MTGQRAIQLSPPVIAHDRANLVALPVIGCLVLAGLAGLIDTLLVTKVGPAPASAGTASPACSSALHAPCPACQLTLSPSACLHLAGSCCHAHGAGLHPPLALLARTADVSFPRQIWLMAHPVV